MDYLSYNLGYLKDSFQQESGCFSQEVCVHLVKRRILGGFFFTSWYFVLVSRVANAGLT